MTNTPSPTDEDRELIERLTDLGERCGLMYDDLAIIERTADRLESLLSDRAKLEERVRTLKAIVVQAALDAPDDEEPR